MFPYFVDKPDSSKLVRHRGADWRPFLVNRLLFNLSGAHYVYDHIWMKDQGVRQVGTTNVHAPTRTAYFDQAVLVPVLFQYRYPVWTNPRVLSIGDPDLSNCVLAASHWLDTVPGERCAIVYSLGVGWMLYVAASQVDTVLLYEPDDAVRIHLAPRFASAIHDEYPNCKILVPDHGELPGLVEKYRPKGIVFADAWSLENQVTPPDVTIPHFDIPVWPAYHAET